MRLLALVLPRLGIQLARQSHPELCGKPFALLAGAGETALVAVPSVEATAGGVEAGMTVAQALDRVPSLTTLPDNAGACLDALEGLASILRTNATPNVAIVSRETILVSLEGMEGRFRDEESAASAFVRYARTWTGLDVRAGVASAIEGAIRAARTSRRLPVVCQLEGATEPLPREASPLTARGSWEQPLASSAVEAKLARAMVTLEYGLEAAGASYRALRFIVSDSRGSRVWKLTPPAPLHTAAEAFELVRARIPAEALEGAKGFTLTLDRPGPDVRVDPWRRPVATVHTLAGPAVPVQHRLRLAS